MALKRARYIVEPYIFIRHCADGVFIGQDVLVMPTGELWLFERWGAAPAQFNAWGGDRRKLAVRKSRDGGRSWGERILLPVDWNVQGICESGGTSVLRLQSGRIVLITHRRSLALGHSGSHGVPVITTSDDDGQTWSPARLLYPHDDIYYVMNQRLIQMDDSRLVLPVSGRDPRVPLEQYGEGRHPCQSSCFLSDDQGETWRPSRGLVRDLTERGVQEPCVAQVGPMRLLMLYRSGHGCHRMSLSEDGGDTWSEPEDTPLLAACSPLTLTTLPDGRLFLAYNHAAPLFPESYFPRNPLTYSLSADGGRTWSPPVVIDDQPGQQLIYPSITPTAEGLLVVYCAHYDPGDGHFSAPPEAWQVGGGKCCVIPYPT